MRLGRHALAFTSMLVVALPMASPAAAWPKPKKPDLVLTHSRLHGKPFAFLGETAKIAVKDTVKNAGSAAAGPTLNELTLHHKGAAALRDRTRAVPRLKKGESSDDDETARIDLPADAKPGRYGFKYDLGAGNVVSQVSGSLGGCTYSGGGVDAGPTGYLSLGYGNHAYNGGVTATAPYTYFFTCNGQTYPAQGPINIGVLSTDNQKLEFGEEKLAGSSSNGYTNYTWSLK